MTNVRCPALTCKWHSKPDKLSNNWGYCTLPDIQLVFRSCGTDDYDGFDCHTYQRKVE